MSAYATAQPARAIQLARPDSLLRAHEAAPAEADRRIEAARARPTTALPGRDSLVEALIDDIAERVAASVAAKLADIDGASTPEWLDSRDAADYLGVHRDTLRKLAAERAIPTHQDGPGCKLFFRRSDLDEWRQSGGRAAQVGSILRAAA